MEALNQQFKKVIISIVISLFYLNTFAQDAWSTSGNSVDNIETKKMMKMR